MLRESIVGDLELVLIFEKNSYASWQRFDA